MKTSVRTTLALLALTTAAGFLTSNAFAADTPWQKAHPRREEVNHRLHVQNQRITHEVKEGEITHQQAHQLRANDRGVRAQERSMARQDGSHITKVDDKALNQELNKNSKAIGQ
ncbi:hypothetical protein [Polaromonas sp. C04]|uniref:hypothetical protein n=1 Tax=Polaromonas sp. C04 TaxID=1945857 RepID=UPI0009848981|nr:hypothetical protein [Polaromonas sp. C04]OOG49898.1 hypothetical protein B0E49_19595 [Polaromonas sp. C04]